MMLLRDLVRKLPDGAVLSVSKKDEKMIGSHLQCFFPTEPAVPADSSAKEATVSYRI